ncbi:MAG TPA: hypothetical protein VI299_13180 [Polyangiales bacterium]
MHKRLWIALVLVLGCGDDDNGGDAATPSSAAATCAKSCARASTANCPNQPSDCQQRCQQQIASSPPSCLPFVNAYASCLTNAVFSCDRQGAAEAQGCARELAAWLQCEQPSRGDAGGSDAGANDASANDASSPGTPDASATPDAGSPRPGDGGSPDASAGLSCTVGGNDNTCDRCLKPNCCTELTACTGACYSLLACSQSCAAGDATCTGNCLTLYGAGRAGAQEIYACMADACPEECANELGG